MTPDRFARISAVLDRRQPDLTVITDEVHKGRNLAAILRSCDAVGVGRIHCAMPEQGYQVFAGTSASADKWVKTCHYSSVIEPLQMLRDQGFQIVAANKTPGARHYREIDYCLPTAVVLGAEIKGVSKAASSLVDAHVYLPMVGMVESFNVSVACAVILMEVERQRSAQGMYASCRLSDEERTRLFFQWAHPLVAEYCDKRGLVYPAVREDGEIANPSEWYALVRTTQD